MGAREVLHDSMLSSLAGADILYSTGVAWNTCSEGEAVLAPCQVTVSLTYIFPWMLSVKR